MKISAMARDFDDINRQVRQCGDRTIEISDLCGQRYIASGLSGKSFVLSGTPGNALGAYLDGCDIYVLGNAQDATGDTMNAGRIIINGSAGDATGYAMRGGSIYVRGNAGYRAGIHMKEYKEKVPTIVVGGKAGSFLGEYQAGGTIIVLGIGGSGDAPVGNFCGTGMHGGHIYLRCDRLPGLLPDQISAAKATDEDMARIAPIVRDFCDIFHIDADEILGSGFFVLSPNSKNPYKQMYTYV